MATYNYNGQTFAAPDEMPVEEVMRLLHGSSQETQHGSSQEAQPQVASSGSAEPHTKVEESSLQFNKDWVEASRILWQHSNPANAKMPNDAELATYGAQQMDWDNGNTPVFMLDAARVHAAPDEYRKAYVYLMDTYPNVKWSLRSVMATATAAAADPLNYVGLASFGYGTVANQTAKAFTKEGLKTALKAGIVAGVENSFITGASNIAEQGMRVDAGQQQSIDPLQVGKAAAIGGAAGVVLGSAIHTAGSAIKERVNAGKDAPKLVDEPSPPVEPVQAGEAPPATPGAPKVETPVSEALRGTEEVPPVEPTVTQGETPKAEGEQMELPLGDEPTPPPRPEPVFSQKYDELDQEAGRLLEEIRTKGETPETKERLKQVWREMDELEKGGAKAEAPRGEAPKDQTGVWFLDGDPEKGDKDFYAWNSKGDLKTVMGDRAAEIQSHPSVTEGGVTVWYKDEAKKAEAERLAKLMDRVQNGGKSKETTAEMHREIGKVLGYGADADSFADNFLAKAVKDEKTGKWHTPREEPRVDAKAEPRPDPRVDNPIIKALDHVVRNDGFRDFPTSPKAMSEDAKAAVDLINNTPPEQLKAAVEEARAAKVEPEVRHALDTVWRDATEALLRRVAELEKAKDTVGRDKALEQLEAVRPADIKYSSGDGASLNARRDLVNTNEFREVDVESILREKGIDPGLAKPEQVAAARDEFSKRIQQRVEALDRNRDIERLKQVQDEAIKAGDNKAAVKAGMERRALMEAAVAAEADPAKKALGQAALQAQRALVELMISNVFSPKTLVMNIIPSAIKMALRPGLDAIVRGGDRVAWRQAAVAYSTMWSSQKAALEAAFAAFRYERGLLSGDMSKVLEDGRAHAIPRWMGGHFIRMFPRIVGATDEYMSQILYRSYAASESYLQMFEKGLAEGMNEKAAHEYAQGTIRTYLDRAFTKAPMQDTIDALYQLGVQRGFKGPKLEEWIKTELDKNGHLFQTPNYDSGISYGKDMLFQRQFSGENMASRVAKQYESTVNNFPIMRLFGQLFFRTPVRVFEESVRLTPGLNLIAPNFLRDLAGKGPGKLGAPAHLRAQGEAMMSLAIGSAVMAMYARGRITGGGMDDNWRQKKSLQNGGYEPYTMYFGDPKDPNTYKFNFRNYDPFAGPLKIIANAMDSFNLLQTRVAQGEYTGNDEGLVLAHITAGAHALVTAFKDASLTQGFSELNDLIKNSVDPENNEDQLMRYIAKKAAMLIPSTATKVQSLSSESQLDPATFSQMMLSRVAPNTKGLPKQYDILGTTNTDPNPMAQLTGIDLRQDARSNETLTPKQKFIGKKLNEITVLTGKHWVPPYDAGSWVPSGLQGWKGVDLRAEMTKDGRETYWDRANRYLAKSGLENQLYAVLNSRSTIGVPSVPESQLMGKQVQELVNNARQAAFLRVLSEEHGIGERHIEAIKGQAQAITGKRDVQIAPYK